jgi:hypothetical protein
MTDKGYEDGRKFRDSMSAVLKSAIFSPTVVPQAFKPLVEIGINYDFYSGRPLIGHFEKMKETEAYEHEYQWQISREISRDVFESEYAAPSLPYSNRLSTHHEDLHDNNEDSEE